MGRRWVPLLSLCHAGPVPYLDRLIPLEGKNAMRRDAKWSEQTNAHTPERGPLMTTTTRTPARPAVWRPCATCWGQRRIYQDRNGEGLVPQTCPACIGVGEELVALG